MIWHIIGLMAGLGASIGTFLSENKKIKEGREQSHKMLTIGLIGTVVAAIFGTMLLEDAGMDEDWAYRIGGVLGVILFAFEAITHEKTYKKYH